MRTPLSHLQQRGAFCGLHKRRRRRRKRKLTNELDNLDHQQRATRPAFGFQTGSQMQIIRKQQTAARPSHLKVNHAQVDKYNFDQRVECPSSRQSNSEMDSTRRHRQAAATTATNRRTTRQSFKVASSAIIMLTIMQLICDTGRPLAFSGVDGALSLRQANSDPEADSASSSSSSANSNTFLMEPSDTWVSVGQQYELSCVVSGQLAHAKLMWFRHKTVQLTNGLELKRLSSRYAVSKEPLDSRQLTALVNGQPRPASSASSTTNQDNKPVGMKYSLIIKSVALDDNDDFHCVLDDDQTQFVSRLARLTVLAPPTRLEIRDLRSTSSDEAAAASGMIEEPTGSNQDSNESPVQTIEVRQNALVELECRSNLAKPHAELTWLDENQQLVPSLTSQQARLTQDLSDNETVSIAPQSYTEQFIRLNETGSGPASLELEETRLVWTFRARREQHHKLLTCVANHKAFSTREGEQQPPGRHKLERVVQLSVLYEPEVELSREPLQPQEFAPLRFYCNAHARPTQMHYNWFIDEQLVPNATEPELYLPAVTRQLHLREIRCQVANAIGRTSANVTRLAIKYSPAYVTHLLPASLQPEHLVQASTQPQLLRNNNWPNNQPLADGSDEAAEQLPMAQKRADESMEDANNFKRLFEQLDQRVAAELAVGVHEPNDRRPHVDASLRCDFDSNPQPVQVQWFKINTEYSNMRDVTPDEANELIAMGASRATFTNSPQPFVSGERATSTSEQLSVANMSPQAIHSKRHISIEQSALNVHHHHQSASEIIDESDLENSEESSANEPLVAGNHRHELDFERMSSELSYEMGELEREQRRLSNQSESLVSEARFIETIPSNQILPASQTIVTIEEPLEFKMISRRTIQGHKLSSLNRANATTGGRIVSHTSNKELILLDPTHARHLGPSWQISGARRTPKMQLNRVNGRQAQLTSSTLELKRVSVDSIGRYVCKARAQLGFNSTAKAVFLVLRQRPRIISVKQQKAPLGATQVQVECLVQINTVQDNQTTIKWFRKNKLINLEHKFDNVPRSVKNVTIIKEMSPDALFIRSTLRISGADRSDFGTYRCVVSNSIDRDTVEIELESVPTANILRMIATSIFVLLFCMISISALIFLLHSCNFSDKSRMMRKTDANDDVKKSDTGASKQSGAKQMSQTNSISSNQSISSCQLNGSKRNFDSIDHGRIQRPGSAFSATHLHSSPMNQYSNSTGSFRRQAGQQQQQQQFAQRTCSFRNAPIGQHHNQSQQSRQFGQQSNRFAAIHETLEHKLQLQPNVSSQQQTPRGSSSSASSTATAACHEEAHEQLAREQNSINQQHATETAAASVATKPQEILAVSTGANGKASFIERLRARFAGESAGNQRSGRRFASGKRPVISMPLANGLNSSLKRSNLSNSLTLVADELASGAESSAPGKQLMMMHLNQRSGEPESQLVSSSANLIQDSTTNSDGTASSGRSSSTSNNPNHQQAHQVNFQQQQLQQQPSSFAVPPPVGPRPQHINWITSTTAATNCDNSLLYANGASLAYDGQTAQLYTNEHMQYPSTSLAYAQSLSNGMWPTQATVVEQQQAQELLQNDHLNGHYQMPMLISEPYLTQLVGQQCDNSPLGRPTYATICTTQAAASHNFAASLTNNSSNSDTKQMVDKGAGEMTNGHYGALGLRQPPMVPTSDGGEAFFESHYGTLLASHAASGAYKTLGYATSHPLHSTDSAASSSNSSAGGGSSSPANSLTTHANLAGVAQLAAPFASQRQLDDNDNELSTPRPHHHHLQLVQQQQQQSLECATNLTNDSTSQPTTIALKQQQQQVQLESIRADLATHV